MGNRAFFCKLVEAAPGPVHESPVLGCLKVPYDGEAEAQRAAEAFSRKTYAYRCPSCGKWHLTKHARFRKGDIGRRNR